VSCAVMCAALIAMTWRSEPAAGMQDLQLGPAVVAGDHRDGQVRIGAAIPVIELALTGPTSPQVDYAPLFRLLESQYRTGLIDGDELGLQLLAIAGQVAMLQRRLPCGRASRPPRTVSRWENPSRTWPAKPASATTTTS
jgi:hypothetical protein